MLTATPLSAEQLLAFNDELAALTRAGVPLEQGLLALGDDGAGSLSAFAHEIGVQLEQGQSLESLVSQPHARLPPIYRAVVCAGLRGGRLAVALEGLTVSLRRIADMQQLLRRAAAYPLLLLATAYLLFLFGCSVLVPQMQQSYQAFEVPPTWTMRVLVALSESVRLWWPLPPLVVAALLFWQWRSARTNVHRMGASSNRMLAMYRHGRLLTFCELMALLIEHHVPLAEGVQLAAEASGDRDLARSSHQFAADLRQGQRRPPTGFPPLLGLTLASFHSQAELVRNLRRIAETYERRARRDADWLRLYLPALATIAIGVGVVLLAILSFWGPWLHILNFLGTPEFAKT